MTPLSGPPRTPPPPGIGAPADHPAADPRDGSGRTGDATPPLREPLGHTAAKPRDPLRQTAAAATTRAEAMAVAAPIADALAPADSVRCARCGGARNAFALVLPLGLGERPWPADCKCAVTGHGRGACPSEAPGIAPSSHPCRRHTDRRVRRLTGRLADLTARWRKTAARADRLRRQIERGAAEIAALVTADREEPPPSPPLPATERPR